MRLPLAALLLLVAASSLASDKKPASHPPVAFGVMTHQTGCVIFGEWYKSISRWYGIALLTRAEPMLTVLESQNYKLEKLEMPEDAENLNDLIRRAQADHIKYVKIPQKHTTEQLQQARDLCKQGE